MGRRVRPSRPGRKGEMRTNGWEPLLERGDGRCFLREAPPPSPLNCLPRTLLPKPTRPSSRSQAPPENGTWGAGWGVAPQGFVMPSRTTLPCTRPCCLLGWLRGASGFSREGAGIGRSPEASSAPPGAGGGRPPVQQVGTRRAQVACGSFSVSPEEETCRPSRPRVLLLPRAAGPRVLAVHSSVPGQLTLIPHTVA